MKKFLIFMGIFGFFVSAACGVTSNFGFQTIEGSGKIVTENRAVSDFTRVEVCCGMELYLTQGETESLEIKADDNFMEEITTQVANGTLVIRYQQQTNVSYRPSQPVILTLTMPEVRGVNISGGGYFETESVESEGFDLNLSGGSDARIDRLVTGNMQVNISGGGKLTAGVIEGEQVGMGFSGSSGGEILSLTAATLELEASGGGLIRISGTVTEQDINLSGGSSYRAGDFESEVTIFSASGGGDSTVWVIASLTVQLSGGSNLSYYGQPQISNQSTSGGSEIDPLGLRE